MTPELLLKFVNERVGAILARPGMWGDQSAIEAQILLLMELKALAHNPLTLEENPRLIMNRYGEFLKTHTGNNHHPLQGRGFDDEKFIALITIFTTYAIP